MAYNIQKIKDIGRLKQKKVFMRGTGFSNFKINYWERPKPKSNVFVRFFDSIMVLFNFYDAVKWDNEKDLDVDMSFSDFISIDNLFNNYMIDEVKNQSLLVYVLYNDIKKLRQLKLFIDFVNKLNYNYTTITLDVSSLDYSTAYNVKAIVNFSKDKDESIEVYANKTTAFIQKLIEIPSSEVNLLEIEFNKILG